MGKKMRDGVGEKTKQKLENGALEHNLDDRREESLERQRTNCSMSVSEKV